MHPQHMQSSSALHLPLVTAMTGQVKVSVVKLVLRPTKFGHGGLQDGFSNTAEIFKILIIFFPNFIVIISWSILMLVIASQVVGVKQIYKLDKISTAVGVVIASYIAQFFIIGLLVFILIKLAY